MKLEENLYISSLLEIYGDVLSENQTIIMKEFLVHDLTISEIAENHNITRQAVLDVIKKSKEKLIYFEEKLKFLSKKKQLLEKLDLIRQIKESDEIKSAIKELEEEIKFGNIF